MKKLYFIITLALFSFSSTKAQINLKSGLVAYYTLDGHAVDSGPNGLNGTLIGGTKDVSRFLRPTATNFNGTSDGMVVPHNSLLNLTSDKSISVWYKITSSSGLKQFPTLVYKAGIGTYPTYGIQFLEDAGYGANRYKIAFIFGVSTTSNNICVTKQDYRSYVNQWVHLVSTYNSTNGYMRIYFNGIISDSTYIGGVSSNSSTDSLKIGKGVIPSNSNFFKGSIDDVKLFNRCVNQSEVLALYNEHLEVFSQKPVVFCQGDSVLAGGKYRKVTGAYYDTLYLSNNVDSIIVTNITVNPSYLIPQTATICSGGKILLGGKLRTTAGVYYDSLQTTKGCDSIFKTTLIVNPSYYIPKTVNICAGQSYFAGGANQNTTGTYFDSLITAKGCDSIIATTLIINPKYNILRSVEICQGDSIKLGGTYRKTTGLYYDSLLTKKNCDSVIVTNLKVNPIYFVIRNAKLCDGDSIFLENKYRKTAGQYFDTLHSKKGCDSIKVTNLVITPSYFIPVSIEICQGDSALIAGSYRHSQGVYQQNLNSINGCDSITETTLTVNPVYFSVNTVTICGGDSVLIKGAYVKTTGIYYDSLFTAKGCDSIIVTNVFVNTISPVVTQNSYVLVAQEGGATYQWLDCNNSYGVIAGETQQSFIATANGNYAVEITKGGCTDTSMCYSISGLNVDEVFAQKIAVYPNPAKDWFTVDLGQNYTEIKVSVITISGKLVSTYTGNNSNEIEIPSGELAAGMYLLEINGDGKKSISKIVIE